MHTTLCVTIGRMSTRSQSVALRYDMFTAHKLNWTPVRKQNLIATTVVSTVAATVAVWTKQYISELLKSYYYGECTTEWQ